MFLLWKAVAECGLVIVELVDQLVQSTSETVAGRTKILSDVDWSRICPQFLQFHYLMLIFNSKMVIVDVWKVLGGFILLIKVP